MTTLPVLWLYGPSGIGKTTVTWELFVRLVREGISTGYVDIDQLGMCYARRRRSTGHRSPPTIPAATGSRPVRSHAGRRVLADRVARRGRGLAPTCGLAGTTADPAATGHRERNRRGQGGRLRTDIVNAAAELLDEAGNEQAVTLRAVARRIGIAAPSIYAHFPDRQAILLAVVQDAFAELAEALRATDKESTGAVAGLRAACTAYLDFAATRPQRYRVMFGGLWNAGDALDSAAVAAGFPWPADITERLITSLAHLTGVRPAAPRNPSH
jgi:AcrR family transcriptional regulator